MSRSRSCSSIYVHLRTVVYLANFCCVRHTVPRLRGRRSSRLLELRRRGNGERCVDVSYSQVLGDSPDVASRQRCLLYYQDYCDVVLFVVVAGSRNLPVSSKCDVIG